MRIHTKLKKIDEEFKLRIHAKIKDLNEEYKFDSPSVLEKIFAECESIKKLFPEKPYYGNPGHYIIMHKNSLLREGMSQIHNFRNGQLGPDYDSLMSDHAKSFWHLFHKSMSKKKNIDVIVYYDKD